MNTIVRVVLGLLLLGAFIIFGPANSAIVAVQPVSVAPVAAETVVAGQGPVPFEKVSVSTSKAPKTTGADDPAGWVRGVAAEAGLSFGGVRVEVTSAGNCGEGCTYATIVNGMATNPQWVKIQPRIIGTEYGKFVVLHELGHVNGIVNECEADQFAINHGAAVFHDAHC